MTVTFQGSETGIGSSGYTPDDPDAQTLLADDVTLTTVTYYDNYACRTFAGFADISSQLSCEEAYGKGQPTASRTAVYGYSAIGGCQVNYYLYTLSGYDAEGRVTSQVETTALAGATLSTSTTYTRQGRPAISVITLQTTDSIFNVTNQIIYHADGSPLREVSAHSARRIKYIIAPVTLSTTDGENTVNYSYDNLGRLDMKGFQSGNSIEYAYNLRGQLTGLSHTAYRQTLYYETGATPCYNGNISAIKQAFGSAPDITRTYAYDNLNRLTACTSTDGFNTAYAYNLNSSPLAIERYGLLSDGTVGLVDDLALIYDGNRMTGVTDYADKVILASSLDFDAPDGEALYEYDSDGRLTTDSGRGITSIKYTPDNRPITIKIGNSTFDNSYTADGRRIYTRAQISTFPQIVASAPNSEDSPNGFGDILLPPVISRKEIHERYYIGPFELSKSNARASLGKQINPGLSRINTSWGYIDSKGDSYEYVSDYQGNIRAVMKGDEVVQQTDYYPYGLPIATSTSAAANRYKYSAKEFETRAGLNSLDFHARQYAPALPFFDVLDPKAWDYPGYNPYLYCAANPIMNTDPTGMIIHDGSQEEWEHYKNLIALRIMIASAMVSNCNDSSEEGKRQKELWSNIYATLVNTASTMNQLEESSQVYALHQDDKGRLSYDSTSDIITINYISDSNFVHELTHAGQFENGEIAYSPAGNPVGVDIYDEIEAYRAEEAFLKSGNPANSLSESIITPAFILNIQDEHGNFIYRSDGEHGISPIPLNINSTYEEFITAYPKIKNVPYFKTLKDLPWLKRSRSCGQ